MRSKELYEKGIIHLKKGEFHEALLLFNRSLEIDPDHPDLLSERGVVYLHMGKMDLSIMDMNRALQLDSSNPYRYSSRAYVKDSMGDVYGAIEDYQKAIELDPEDAVAYNNLGLLEEKLGRMEQAKRRFEKADQLALANNVFGGDFSSSKKHDAIDSRIADKKPVPEDTFTEQKPTRWSIVRSLFTSRESFKEFLSFIKNGFRLK